MSVVVDASVVLGLVLPDEAVPVSLAQHLRGSTPVAPALLAYEVGNAVASAVRRGRLTDAEGRRVLDLVARLGIELEDPPPVVELMGLAVRTGLSGYDAAYLELAMRTGSALLTADGPLADAARGAGVPVPSG